MFSVADCAAALAAQTTPGACSIAVAYACPLSCGDQLDGLGLSTLSANTHRGPRRNAGAPRRRRDGADGPGPRRRRGDDVEVLLTPRRRRRGLFRRRGDDLEVFPAVATRPRLLGTQDQDSLYGVVYSGYTCSASTDYCGEAFTALLCPVSCAPDPVSPTSAPTVEEVVETSDGGKQQRVGVRPRDVVDRRRRRRRRRNRLRRRRVRVPSARRGAAARQGVRRGTRRGRDRRREGGLGARLVILFFSSLYECMKAEEAC